MFRSLMYAIGGFPTQFTSSQQTCKMASVPADDGERGTGPEFIVTADSPCNSLCALDANQVCRGCFRSLDEIGRWSGCSPAERIQINRCAFVRRQLAGLGPAASPEAESR
ncbi:MAG: DUF1289 domain-containing protein [Planctomycetota bacterium]